MSLMFGWNPWASMGVGILGWNPWGFAANGGPSASLVRSIATAQSNVAPARTPVGYTQEPFDDPGAYLQTGFEFRMSMLAAEFVSAIRLEFDAGARAVSVLARDGTLIVRLVSPTADRIDNAPEGLASTRDRHPADSGAIDDLVAQNEYIDAYMLRSAGAVPERDGAKYEFARALCIMVNLVCLRMKHAFNVKRPSELDRSIVPMLPVPAHASFPGGHATMAAALALAIEKMVAGTHLPALAHLAAEISLNRVRAGLHYQLDSDAGLALGFGLAGFVVSTLADDAGRPADQRVLPLLGVVWAEATKV